MLFRTGKLFEFLDKNYNLCTSVMIKNYEDKDIQPTILKEAGIKSLISY